ncbi:MAG: hypothetical protein ABI273_13040 [Lacunisphaera sp.]
MSELVQNRIESDDPVGALCAYRQLEPGEQAEFATKVVRVVADTKPEEAKMLALSLPAGDVRAKAMSELVERLSKKSGAGTTLDWLAQQEPNADFDASYDSLAKALADGRPDRAFLSVSMMTDSSRKEALSNAYGFGWLQKNYAEAVQTLPSEFVSQYDRVVALAAQIRQVSPSYHGTLQF